MNIGESVFAAKLCEMEEHYGKLQCRIRVCERGDGNRIHSELKKAREEYRENAELLQEKARLCRSPAVSKLARAQTEYSRKTDMAVKEQLAEDLHCESSSPQEDKMEADLLYAEFAMDFATLAMQQALISALTALDEMAGEEDKGNGMENSYVGKKTGGKKIE